MLVLQHIFIFPLLLHRTYVFFCADMDLEKSKNICTVNEASMTKNTVNVEFFTRFCRLQVSVKLQCISQSILYLVYLSSNGTKFVIYGYHKMQLQTRTCIYCPFFKKCHSTVSIYFPLYYTCKSKWPSFLEVRFSCSKLEDRCWLKLRSEKKYPQCCFLLFWYGLMRRWSITRV